MFALDAQYLEPIGGAVGEVVGWGVEEGVGFEAKGAADAASATAAGGEHVDVSVADHNGFAGQDRNARYSAGLGDEALEAVWVGLLGVEAVAAVVLEEET